MRYRTPIYRTAYGLTGDPQAAEEILQDTFARAYQRRHILRPDVSPLPWLHRVALNLCYSRLGRRRLPSEPMGDAVIGLVRDLATEPAEHAEQQELRRIVRDGVADLPPKHQSVVILYYLHGLSLQETAELLDIRLGTVKSRLHYALALAAHPARGRSSLRRRLRRDRAADRGEIRRRPPDDGSLDRLRQPSTGADSPSPSDRSGARTSLAALRPPRSAAGAARPT